MPLTPALMEKARQIARAKFSKDVIGKLRAKRLRGAVPPAEKRPDEDDLGEYDVLEKMYAESNDKGK